MTCTNIFIAEVFIPVDKSPPFVVGAFLGKGKPEYSFWDDFMEEIKRLSPLAEDSSGTNPRPVLIEILCVICDSPVRFWLTGKVKLNTIIHVFFNKANTRLK
jgi:hypothetical protein